MRKLILGILFQGLACSSVDSSSLVMESGDGGFDSGGVLKDAGKVFDAAMEVKGDEKRSEVDSAVVVRDAGSDVGGNGREADSGIDAPSMDSSMAVDAGCIDCSGLIVDRGRGIFSLGSEKYHCVNIDDTRYRVYWYYDYKDRRYLFMGVNQCSGSAGVPGGGDVIYVRVEDVHPDCWYVHSSPLKLTDRWRSVIGDHVFVTSKNSYSSCANSRSHCRNYQCVGVDGGGAQ